MTKLLTVIGATGTQGASVVDAVLSSQSDWKIRALTRNPSSKASHALQAKGAEVTQCDLNDAESVKRAFEGSYAIFAVTDFFVPFLTSGSVEAATDVEWKHCRNIVKAAADYETLKHFIFSTLPQAKKISGGKFHVPHFDTKNRAEELIKQDKELLAKTTFLWVGWYGDNFRFPIFQPTPLETAGKHIQLVPAPASTPINAIGDARINVGKFVVAILQQPEKTLPGRYVNGVVEETTLGGLLSSWSSVTEKDAVYVEVDMKTYDALWPGWAVVEGANLQYFYQYGDKSWSKEDKLVTASDIGLDVKTMDGVKDAVRKMTS